MNSTLQRQSVPILVAEDDDDDRLLTQEAFTEVRCANPLHFVQDGKDLMDYLYRRAGYTEISQHPRPGLILLDLNMPNKDGRRALTEIKADTSLCRIPIVVLTTSKAEEDILQSYALGVNSFIVKPVTFQKLVEIVHALTQYWFNIVTLPPEGH